MKHSPPPHHHLTERAGAICGLLLVLLAAQASFAIDEKDVIPAERIDLVAENVGKPLVVKGTIGLVTTAAKSGHCLMEFEEGDLTVFIRKANLEEHADWDPEEMKGKEVYVAGQAFVYNSKLQVVIVGPEQIAESAEGFDLKSIPLPEKEKKPGEPKKGPAAPGAIAPTRDYAEFPLKREFASVKTVAFYLKGNLDHTIRDNPFGKDPFKLPLDTLMPVLVDVSAEAKDAPGIGAMQIVFPEPDADREKVYQIVIDQLAGNYGAWPRDKIVTIDVDFESRGFRDAPSGLVVATLLHSMIKDAEIPSNLVISADLTAAGDVIAPQANGGNFGPVTDGDIVRAIAKDAEEPLRYLRAAMDYSVLNDLAIDGEWETLSLVSAISVPNLRDALQLAFAAPDSELGTALKGFDQVQAVIRKSGVQMVNNTHVQQRVLAAGKAWPKNQSAVFYALHAKRQVPRAYSTQRAHQLLGENLRKLEIILTSMPDDAKDRLRDIDKDIKSLGSHFEKDALPLIGSLSEFQDAVSAAVLKRKEEGRGLDRQKEDVTQSHDKIVAGLDELAKQLETSPN